MGNLTHAVRVLITGVAALLVSAAPVQPADPNDRIWIAQYDQPQTGNVSSGVTVVPGGFLTAVASWNVTTPGGSALRVELRARHDERWTRWWTMGQWSVDQTTGKRHSVAKQADADGNVDTDTLTLTRAADAFEVRAIPVSGTSGEQPQVRLLAVATSRVADSSVGTSELKPPAGPVVELAVPERTQRIPTSPDATGGGGDSWCSPASVSMVMAYWAQARNHPEWDVDVATAADGVYDPVYDGCGNWPFNVAYASEHGLAGFVRQFPSLRAVELLVTRGIPIIASIAVKPGDLDGAPYEKTAGHLLVIRGFTSDNDVVVNDPYAEPGSIRRVYRRAQFERVWQDGSNGTVYIIAPPEVVRTLH